MTRAKLDRELERIHRARIAINNKPYSGDLGGYRAKRLQELERQEAKIISELTAIKEAA